MKLTNRRFLIAMTVAAFIATSAGFGIADTQFSAKQAANDPASAESSFYSPAEYTMAEHLQ